MISCKCKNKKVLLTKLQKRSITCFFFHGGLERTDRQKKEKGDQGRRRKSVQKAGNEERGGGGSPL